MEKILKHMLETRPQAEVEYMPYYAAEGIRKRPVLKGWEIDLGRLCPEGKKGQQIWIKTYVLGEKKDNALLNLKGSCSAVYYDGEKVQPKWEDDKGKCYAIEVSPRRRELIVQCTLEESPQILEMAISTVYYRGMEAKDYLNHISTVISVHGLEMEGVTAKPYSARTKDQEEFFAPFGKASGEDPLRVDFGRWYGREKGIIAYAVSCCKRDGRVSIEPFSECRILVNGQLAKEDSSREGAVETKGPPESIHLKKGDVLLIKASKTSSGWGFCCQDQEKVLELPLVKKKEGILGKFLLVGAFGAEDSVNTLFGPERRLQWKTPYFNAAGERCFWRFNAERLYLRPYVNTSFFGQWFYALMVGNYGLLCASEFLGRRELTDYFLKNMELLSDFFEYAKYDGMLFGEPPFLQRSVFLDNLDSIGAVGMCLAESYQRTLDGRTLSVVLELAQAARRNVPRFQDGSFHRKDTMWADDVFMSVPFFARMWEITGKEEYLSECICQFRGFQKRLYIREKGIFSHIYFLDKERANGIPWGRGNGWVFLSAADFLKKLWEHEKGNGLWEKAREILAFFREFAAGVVRYQDQEGMWHQILDEETSYQETSCTGMFVTGISYGVSCGFLGPSYIYYARKGMEALRRKAITEEGVVKGVCRGSGCSMERSYYRTLGAVDDDDHGTGIVLLAMTALQEAERAAVHKEESEWKRIFC